ncbi:MAG: type I-C CRISPR-associated protein Cas8c/Csd1 [Desulfobacteraceae bacterium]|nr:type I-C CRISPR-associated protein Cas8c/Csd1 [Desulfobacteraceae bacterium]
MILQALYELALSENLMNDPDYQWKPVAWIVRIGKNGEFLGVSGTHYTPEPTGKKKPKPVAKSMRVPYQPGRSGKKAPAYFFVDNAKYVFGVPTGNASFSPKEGAAKAAEFREKIRQCAEETGDSGAIAVLRFLENAANKVINIDLPDESQSNDQFGFLYEPDIDLLVHERPEIEKYWKKIRNQEEPRSNNPFYCIVSGEKLYEPGLFPLIKNVPGGTSSGVGFVSFNQNSFLSYGLSGNENAPVSRFAAEACATALNRLLHYAYPDPNHPGGTLPRRHIKLSSDTAVCFWSTDTTSQDFIDFIPPILEANPEEVNELYHCIWKGQTPPDLDTSRFYALIISGAQGRAIVRDWFESTIQDTAAHISKYFSDVEIARNTPKPKNRDLPPQIPLPVLLRSLAVYGRSDEIPPHVASEMTAAAISGRPFPMTIMHRAIERMRAEIGDTTWLGIERRDARAAIIKAVLSRNFKTEVTKEMDPNNREPGYLLGRLLAVVERIQQEAMGDVNASVIDRYFSGASASPGSVFPRLLKNMRNHIRKAKDSDQKRGTAFWLDKQADEIMSGITEFPGFLPIEQQGLFILGYHHQRNDLWKKKSDKTEDNTPAIQEQE